MALVYSYVRFSTKKQMDGDSLRRQVELGDEWIQRHNHTPATLTLHDLGVSAFKGRNKHSGALHKFVDAIETGRVQPGSYLLVENLDRLSRQGIYEALALFNQILSSGVNIVCMRPNETVYTQKSLDDLVGMLIPLICFHLAHLESKNKSDRLSDLWRQRRKIADASGKPIDGLRPAWLDWDPESRTFTPNEGQHAVRYIFQRTADGIGQRNVVAELQKDFTPIGRSGKWNGSYVQKVLSDRSVLGERQNHTFSESGERVATGSPIPGYYPAIIDESLWFRAQTAKAANRKHKGPSSEFVNLFTGLLHNANDGAPMHIQTTRNPSGNYVQRRLVSYAYTSKMSGADPVGVLYPMVEKAVLMVLDELRPEDLDTTASVPLLREKEQERLGVAKRLTELQEAMSDPDAGASVKLLMTSVKTLEARLVGLDAEIARLHAEVHADRPLEHSHTVIAALAEVDDEGRNALRMRLRSLISELVSSIYLKPEKHGDSVYTVAQVCFHSGLTRTVFFGPRRIYGGHVGGSSVDAYGIDMRDRESAQRMSQYLQACAEYEDRVRKRSAEPTPMPEKLPDTVGECLSVWLGVMREKLGPDSFRVVAPKVRPFAEYVGASASTETIDGRLWGLWVRHLKMQVAEGKVARNSARVSYGRSREFVRWLQDNQKVKPIEGLEVSGEVALSPV